MWVGGIKKKKKKNFARTTQRYHDRACQITSTTTTTATISTNFQYNKNAYILNNVIIFLW